MTAVTGPLLNATPAHALSSCTSPRLTTVCSLSTFWICCSCPVPSLASCLAFLAVSFLGSRPVPAHGAEPVFTLFEHQQCHWLSTSAVAAQSPRRPLVGYHRASSFAFYGCRRRADVALLSDERLTNGGAARALLLARQLQRGFVKCAGCV